MPVTNCIRLGLRAILYTIDVCVSCNLVSRYMYARSMYADRNPRAFPSHAGTDRTAQSSEL